MVKFLLGILIVLGIYLMLNASGIELIIVVVITIISGALFMKEAFKYEKL